MTTTIALPDVESMTLHELMAEIKASPNAATGKPGHSLTEISRIAGCPRGFPAVVFRKPATYNEEIEKYGPALRKYVRTIRDIAAEREARTFPLDAVPIFGAVVATPHPNGTQPPPLPKSRTVAFAEEFDALKDRLWAETEAMESLIATAPPLFKPAVGELRDRLLTLLQEVGD